MEKPLSHLEENMFAQPFGLSGMSARDGAPPLRRSRARAGDQEIFWVLLVVSVAAFVLLGFRPNRERLREMRMESALLGQEIGAMEARLEHLRGWARALASDDRDAWACVVREKLGWLAPGEKIRPPPVSLSEGSPLRVRRVLLARSGEPAAGAQPQIGLQCRLSLVPAD